MAFHPFFLYLQRESRLREGESLSVTPGFVELDLFLQAICREGSGFQTHRA